MSHRLSESDIKNVIAMYTVRHLPCGSIAAAYGMSRMGIWKCLQRQGVNTADHKLEFTCVQCGKQGLKTRKLFRTARHHFCSRECYRAWLKAIAVTKESVVRRGYSARQLMRDARATVSLYFNLEPGMVVHHEDGNRMNNDPHNLKVYACQGDHIRYHRDCSADKPGLDLLSTSCKHLSPNDLSA